jgi:hypothetical protein
MTKLGPYGWPEDVTANNSSDNKDSGTTATPGSNSSNTSKRKAENGRSKGARKQFNTDEQETITKALRIIVNTLCKRVDRLSDKDLILFSALLARYKCIPGPDSDDDEIRWITFGTAA